MSDDLILWIVLTPISIAILAVTAYGAWTGWHIHKQRRSLRLMNGNRLPETDTPDDH